MSKLIQSLEFLGPCHPDSYTADWCVAVWYIGDYVLCDTERGNGTVSVMYGGDVSVIDDVTIIDAMAAMLAHSDLLHAMER